MERLKFAEFEFIPPNQILYFKWLPNTEDAQDEDIKVDMLIYRDLITNQNIKSVIVDERELKFIFAPDFQEWIIENITQKITENGLERLAIIQSRDLIINLAIEQVIEDNQAPQVPIMFFETFEEAKNWVINKGKNPEILPNN